MPREKRTGECSECHQIKPLFDVKHNVCGVCLGRKGGITPKKHRGKKVFLCDACERPVKTGQSVCICGAKIDWSIVQKVTHGPAVG